MGYYYLSSWFVLGELFCGAGGLLSFSRKARARMPKESVHKAMAWVGKFPVRVSRERKTAP